MGECLRCVSLDDEQDVDCCGFEDVDTEMTNVEPEDWKDEDRQCDVDGEEKEVGIVSYPDQAGSP